MEEKSKIAWDNKSARKALAKYESLVRGMARRLRPLALAGRGLDVEDLEAEGRIAVLEALSTYAGFGVAEKSWVRMRVRQRMIDAIRRLDPRTRGEMRRLVAHAAGKTSEEDEEACRAIAARRVVSLDVQEPGREPLVAQIADQSTMRPDDAAHANRLRAQLHGLIKRLPERARVTLELRLFEGASLSDVGAQLGVSASRACQLQRVAVRRLNTVLAAAA